MSSNYLSKIIAAAEMRFGYVEKAAFRPRRADFILMAVRDDAPKKDAPYMTIGAFIANSGEVAFQHGHYDMREGQAVVDFDNRIAL